ncbi:SH3 domain-containing protein [Streptomyces sp. NPDC057621]|uniref:SH3 domain-containing protein n=1 Tax=Streptomyces sp. NPDC057621 TaxID=3346186 RepID=UPI0036CDDC73
MRVTLALRTLGTALVSGGVLAVAAAGTATAGDLGDQRGDRRGGDPVWGTVVSHGDLKVRARPDLGSTIVDRLSPGSQDRVACVTRGSHVFGNPHWYWLVGARAWASAAFVDLGGEGVPKCSDPCEGAWKDRWDQWDEASGSADSGWEWVPGGR